jgi:hypothetical protein
MAIPHRRQQEEIVSLVRAPPEPEGEELSPNLSAGFSVGYR